LKKPKREKSVKYQEPSREYYSQLRKHKNHYNNYFGEELEVGDFDGDGYDDLAVSATEYDSGRGRVYVYDGTATGLYTIPTMFTGDEASSALGEALAAERGHVPLRLEAKPSFANILVWKVVYETATNFHVDAVRTWPSTVVYPGSSIPRLDTQRDLPWLDPASQQARDVERFAWFSNDYVARDPLIPGRVIDVRYSLLPNEIDSLWSIQLAPGAGPEEHVSYNMHRNRRDGQVETLWQMLRGQPIVSDSSEYSISRR